MYLIEKINIWSTGIRVSSVLIVLSVFFVLYVYTYYWLPKYTCIR